MNLSASPVPEVQALELNTFDTICINMRNLKLARRSSIHWLLCLHLKLFLISILKAQQRDI